MLSSVPAGWTRHVHPLGYVYYHKTHQGRIYITQDEITIPDLQNSILKQIDEVERLISLRNYFPFDRILVYLELEYDEGSDGYFLVNNAPESRCIFWLHDIDVAKDPRVRSLDGPADLGACQRNAIKSVSFL